MPDWKCCERGPAYRSREGPPKRRPSGGGGLPAATSCSVDRPQAVLPPQGIQNRQCLGLLPKEPDQLGSGDAQHARCRWKLPTNQHELVRGLGQRAG